MTIAQGMLAEFEPEAKTTRRFLQHVPADKLAWKPHEKSMSLGQLAFHIAEIPFGVLHFGMTDNASPPDFGNRHRPQDHAEIMKQFETSVEFARNTLPTVSDLRMLENFTLSAGGKVILSMPRAAFLRAVLLNHWYHHRGQLGVYLRLTGAKVPSSYGPSGDEAMPPG